MSMVSPLKTFGGLAERWFTVVGGVPSLPNTSDATFSYKSDVVLLLTFLILLRPPKSAPLWRMINSVLLYPPRQVSFFDQALNLFLQTSTFKGVVFKGVVPS